MIFDPTTFVGFHTLISLIALAAGIIVILGLLGSSTMGGMTALYLVTAVATSATGFGFPFVKFLPSHGVAIISLVALLAAILARYVFRYAGAWRSIYVLGIVSSVFFDAFVGIAQSFGKIAALNALAPTGSETPFVLAQGVALVIFVILGIAALRNFRPQSGDRGILSLR